MKGCRLGLKVYHYDVLESTQIEARRLAQEGAPEGTLVIARTQTKGYGRQGAFWHSSPGGLWFSLVLYPTIKKIIARIRIMLNNSIHGNERTGRCNTKNRRMGNR